MEWIEYERAWDTENNAIEQFVSKLTTFSSSLLTNGVGIAKGREKPLDSKSLLYELRFVLRDGERILENLEGLVDHAPHGQREVTRDAVEMFAKMLAPYRESLIAAQNIAADESLEPFDREIRIFELLILAPSVGG